MFELTMSFLQLANDDGAALGGIMATWVAMMGFFWIFYCLALIVGLVFFIIWIWILIDCLTRNDYEGPNDKLLWALVIIFAGIIGAAIYYFMIKREKDKPKASGEMPGETEK